MSIHGICFDEGQSGNCGTECEGFITGECEVPDEVLETVASEAGYTLYITTDKPKPTRRNTMRQSIKLALLQNDYSTVKVSYNLDPTKGDGKPYTFKNTLILVPGDLIVVPHNDEGFKIVRVIEVHETPILDLDARYDYRWTVDQVEVNKYYYAVEQEKEALQKLQNLEAIGVRQRAIEALEKVTGFSVEDLHAVLREPPVAPGSILPPIAHKNWANMTDAEQEQACRNYQEGIGNKPIDLL